MEEEREVTTEDWGEPKSDPLEKMLNLRAWAQEFSYTPEEWKKKQDDNTRD